MAGTTRTVSWSGVLAVGALWGFGLAACEDSVSPSDRLPAPERLGLSGLDGAVHQPIPTAGGKITVLLFSSSDCPVANGYAPEIGALHAEYAGRGVRLFLINIEPSTPVAKLIAHAAEYRLPRPILLDRDHALAASVGATMTPEAVVLSPGGTVAYRGRIDDRYPELGVRRPVATKRELRDAIDALLAGRDVAVPETTAVGCFIEDWAK